VYTKATPAPIITEEPTPAAPTPTMTAEPTPTPVVIPTDLTVKTGTNYAKLSWKTTSKSQPLKVYWGPEGGQRTYFITVRNVAFCMISEITLE